MKITLFRKNCVRYITYVHKFRAMAQFCVHKLLTSMGMNLLFQLWGKQHGVVQAPPPEFDQYLTVLMQMLWHSSYWISSLALSTWIQVLT